MQQIFSFIIEVFSASWALFSDASVYILFGIAVGGLLKMFLSTEYVVRHLGSGRYRSVFKAALFGIPIPLCSCGVLPAAASLKKQGANNGATTAFLISTPESGVDSIAITYALLDPIMTVARPIAAFCSALAAGLMENFFNPPQPMLVMPGASSCPVDNCCDGIDCDPAEHRRHHNLFEKIRAGLVYAAGDLWGDLAGWFFVGILLAGLITTLVPDNLVSGYLGGGLHSMLLMLAVGIPLYICATASTPIAAALILKGVSPGTALVFLLVGPATNMASISVLTGLLGKRATARYLAAIATVSVLCGLALDAVYGALGISAGAVIGKAAQIIPQPVELGASFFLLAISIKPILLILRRKVRPHGGHHGHDEGTCGCASGSCSTKPVVPFPK
ncbi:putative permease [bacterium BMS3Abin13]|nr:putative permease [bacterium BMS3Abin13]